MPEPYGGTSIEPETLPVDDFSPEEAADFEGRSPWYLAWRRLRRNRVALAFLGLFVLIVVFVLAAPLWANNVAHTGPDTTHTTEKITVDGKKRDVVSRRRTADRPGLLRGRRQVLPRRRRHPRPR